MIFTPIYFHKEYEIVEQLFLPHRAKVIPESDVSPLPEQKIGYRTSARQREKQEKMLALQQERERVREQEG